MTSGGLPGVIFTFLSFCFFPEESNRNQILNTFKNIFKLISGKFSKEKNHRIGR